MTETANNSRLWTALLLVVALLALVGAHAAHPVHTHRHAKSVANAADTDSICSNPYLALFSANFDVPAAENRFAFVHTDESLPAVLRPELNIPTTRPPPISL
jgi:hypothetical protein